MADHGVIWWEMPGYWRALKVNLGRKEIDGTDIPSDPYKASDDLCEDEELEAQAAGAAKLRAVLGSVVYLKLDEAFARSEGVESQDYDSLHAVLGLSKSLGNNSDLARFRRAQEDRRAKDLYMNARLRGFREYLKGLPRDPSDSSDQHLQRAFQAFVKRPWNRARVLSEVGLAMEWSERTVQRRVIENRYRKNVAISPETDQKDPSNPPKLRHG